MRLLIRTTLLEQGTPVPEDPPINCDSALAGRCFHQAPTPLLVVDLQGKVIAANAAAERFSGLEVPPAVGAEWAGLLPAAQRPLAAAALNASLQHGTSENLAYAWPEAPPAGRSGIARVSPLRDDAGQVTACLISFEDVTDSVLAQKETVRRARMNALQRLAGSLSHYLNNILGGVVTSVDFALASGDGEVLARVLRKTAVALGRATVLLDQLLAFAQGTHKDEGICELGEVVVEMLGRCEPRLVRTAIGLEVDLRTMPIVEVPRSQVSTVLSILLDNAVEAMPNGGRLSVNVTTAGADVVLRIGDTGCGLDDEGLERVFEPFFSTKGPPEDATRNRGTGLAAAYGIVKALGGTINVSSSPGKGSVFEVRLPVNPPEPSA
jgi:PAS domain S-box-containing protein